ncbi:hypothetical protein [Streptomyces sp. NPDC093589]|uniref:hypothetical protein n=1 Tax=Streptomyces sp. NPDC093589 TaxID=3366043 RepID=UPI0038030843
MNRLGASAGAVLAVAGYVLRVGRVTPARGYALALDAVRDPAARPDPAVPARLHGSGWTWARIAALAVALGTAPVLFFSLGAGAPDRGETAGRIAGADYVIKELPVVAAARVERAGSSPRASEHVERPSGGGSGEGGAKSTSRYPCLTLHTGTGDLPLRLAASHRRAAPVLVGSEGWLVWDPAVSQGKAAAEFLADAGWQLPGPGGGGPEARSAGQRHAGRLTSGCGTSTEAYGASRRTARRRRRTARRRRCVAQRLRPLAMRGASV